MKARIPKHREFVINLESTAEERREECWAKLEAILIPLLDVIIGFSSLASLLYGGYLALIGQITLGRFVAFNQYVNMLVWPMLACSEAAVMFSQGTASIRRVQEILEAQTNVKDTASVTTLDTLHGDIRFDHLTFTHLGNTSPVLHDTVVEVAEMPAIVKKLLNA